MLYLANLRSRRSRADFRAIKILDKYDKNYKKTSCVDTMDPGRPVNFEFKTFFSPKRCFFIKIKTFIK